MIKMTNELASKVNYLVAALIPQSHLSDFLALLLKEQVFGIKFFATISKDSDVIEMCEYIEKVVGELNTANEYRITFRTRMEKSIPTTN